MKTSSVIFRPNSFQSSFKSSAHAESLGSLIREIKVGLTKCIVNHKSLGFLQKNTACAFNCIVDLDYKAIHRLNQGKKQGKSSIRKFVVEVSLSVTGLRTDHFPKVVFSHDKASHCGKIFYFFVKTLFILGFKFNPLFCNVTCNKNLWSNTDLGLDSVSTR